MAIKQSHVDIILSRFNGEEIKFLIDQKDVSRWFIGVSFNVKAALSDKQWKIFALDNVNGVLESHELDDLEIWDNREALFPDLPVITTPISGNKDALDNLIANSDVTYSEPTPSQEQFVYKIGAEIVRTVLVTYTDSSKETLINLVTI